MDLWSILTLCLTFYAALAVAKLALNRNATLTDWYKTFMSLGKIALMLMAISLMRYFFSESHPLLCREFKPKAKERSGPLRTPKTKEKLFCLDQNNKYAYMMDATLCICQGAALYHKFLKVLHPACIENCLFCCAANKQI